MLIHDPVIRREHARKFRSHRLRIRISNRDCKWKDRVTFWEAPVMRDKAKWIPPTIGFQDFSRVIFYTIYYFSIPLVYPYQLNFFYNLRSLPSGDVRQVLETYPMLPLIGISEFFFDSRTIHLPQCHLLHTFVSIDQSIKILIMFIT